MVELDRSQMTIWLMRVAVWITEVTKHISTEIMVTRTRLFVTFIRTVPLLYVFMEFPHIYLYCF